MTHPHSAGGMPEPRHHPSAETLALYAAGNMRPGFDVVVAAHLQACAACRHELATLEQLGGELISGIDPVAMGEEALAATLARLEAPTHVPPPPQGLGDLLSRVRRRWPFAE